MQKLTTSRKRGSASPLKLGRSSWRKAKQLSNNFYKKISRERGDEEQIDEAGRGSEEYASHTG